MLCFNSEFFTHCSGNSNHVKKYIFIKACEKYCNELEKTFKGEPSFWSHTIKK